MPLPNRAVLAYLATALYGFLAAIHVPLPQTFTQASLTTALLLVIAAVTTVVRVRRTGAPEADAKAWWQSKTIWSAVVAAAIAVLTLFDDTKSIDAGTVVAVVMTVFGLVNAWLYPTVAAPIVLPKAADTPPPVLLLVGLAGAAALLSPLAGCASGSSVKLDVDRAFVVAELGFQSVQQTALAGVRSGTITGAEKERVIGLVEQAQQAEDSAIAARRLADTAAEAAALSRLAALVADIHPTVEGN